MECHWMTAWIQEATRFEQDSMLQFEYSPAEVFLVTLEVNRGPFILEWISNYIHHKVWMKLLIHSQTSTVEPLKFGIG